MKNNKNTCFTKDELSYINYKLKEETDSDDSFFNKFSNELYSILNKEIKSNVYSSISSEISNHIKKSSNKSNKKKWTEIDINTKQNENIKDLISEKHVVLKRTKTLRSFSVQNLKTK